MTTWTGMESAGANLDKIGIAAPNKDAAKMMKMDPTCNGLL